MNEKAIGRIGAGVVLGWLLAAGSGTVCGIARADGHGAGAYLNDLEDAGIGGDTTSGIVFAKSCAEATVFLFSATAARMSAFKAFSLMLSSS